MPSHVGSAWTRPRSQDDTRSNIAVVHSPLKPTCSGACVGYLFRTQALKVRKTGLDSPMRHIRRSGDSVQPCGLAKGAVAPLVGAAPLALTGRAIQSTREVRAHRAPSDRHDQRLRDAGRRAVHGRQAPHPSHRTVVLTSRIVARAVPSFKALPRTKLDNTSARAPMTREGFCGQFKGVDRATRPRGQFRGRLRGPALRAISGLYKSGLVSEHDRLHTIAAVELRQHASHVRLDRRLGHTDRRRDLHVR